MKIDENKKQGLEESEIIPIFASLSLAENMSGGGLGIEAALPSIININDDGKDSHLGE